MAHSWLNLIERDMLIVESTGENETRRIRASQLVLQFNDLKTKQEEMAMRLAER